MELRIKCSEEEKILISRMAFQEGVSASEFILGLVNSQKMYYDEVEVFSVVVRKGNVIGRKSLGMYLVDDHGRASVHTTWKEIAKKSREHLDEFKQMPNQHSYLEVGGVKIEVPHPFSDWVVLKQISKEEKGVDIPLAQWAAIHGLDESYARKKARRGSLKTAHKVGRDWFINEKEPNLDNRKKTNTEKL